MKSIIMTLSVCVRDIVLFILPKRKRDTELETERDRNFSNSKPYMPLNGWLSKLGSLFGYLA